VTILNFVCLVYYINLIVTTTRVAYRVMKRMLTQVEITSLAIYNNQCEVYNKNIEKETP